MESKGGEGGEAAAQSAAAAWWAKATKAAVKQWKAAPDGQSAAQREKPPPDSQGQLDRRRQRSVPLSGDWIGRLCLKLERSDMQPRFDDAKKPSYADKHLDRQTDRHPASQLASQPAGWLVGWMALFSSTSRDPHTAARLEKNEKEKTGEKATTASGAADKKLFANFPAVGNVSLVGERTIQPVGKRNRKTQSYKSERLDTGFTTAKSLSR
ncbi:hypothetical protein T01_674 [Trichinella spiralis]|uniref:Uncharacterized protein n=1 Tax=Trichinella spiralis TaxID=6334 RepID=A0A0V1B6P9_TRISP|nr:hypothetical protein T01_674 [Trichinella spiralis]